MVGVPSDVYEILRLFVHLTSIPLVRQHIISVVASETVRQNTVLTVTITTIIVPSFLGNCKSTTASSAYGVPLCDSPGAGSLVLAKPRPFASVSFLKTTTASMTSSFAFKRVKVTRITVTKMLSRKHSGMRPCRRPCSKWNQPGHSPP